MSTQTYFDSKGEKLTLGKELGRGGEGAVYELEGDSHQLVAKIYHEALSDDKQKKILNMAGSAVDDLVNVSAWPVQAIYTKAKRGDVCGFVMGKATGYEPIHHLYSPSSRKQLFPDANWAFLIHAARNVALSMAAIHHHNHVVGDINQGNILISKGAVVKLIDCDSFQIHSSEKDYLCGVGVGHFIPPELQEMDLTNIVRTPNHDNFGLAVIIFHLIMMGRHPYSGLYPVTGEVTLEQAIKNHWFVYSKTAVRKGLGKPPNSLIMGVLPEYIADLFYRAFDPASMEGNGRPSALAWVTELGKFEKDLVLCDKVPIHRYYKGLKGCHWCEYERDVHVTYFIDTSLPTLSTTFDFKKLRKQVADIRSPGLAPEVPVPKTLVPKPVPKRLATGKKVSYLRKIVAVLVLIAVGIFWTHGLIFAVPLMAWLAYFPFDKSKELSIRTMEYESINRTYVEAAVDYRRDAGESRFITQQAELNTLMYDYRDLPNWMDKYREEMKVHVQDRALQRFLATFLIEDYDIPSVTEGFKAVLSSFGIESAADVDWSKVYNVKGSTTVMSDALLAWKNDLEKQFVYDESKGVEKADEIAMMQAYYNRRKSLEAAITTAVEDLINIKEDILKVRERDLEAVTELATQRAQAKADMEFVEKF